MVNFKKEPYLEVAVNVAVFTTQELNVIKEILGSYQQDPGKDYFLIEKKLGERVIGFILFGKNSLTASSWDLHWLIVGKNFQHKGIARKLLEELEAFLLAHNAQALLRLETSTKPEFAPARNLYIKQGFDEADRIPDFYAAGDDLILQPSQG